MSSEVAVPAAHSRLHRPFAWFDPESAAVVTILIGLFQVVLCVPLLHTNQTLPKLFILPLALGILIVAGGSFTMANERNPNRHLLQGCAYSNVAGLLVALLALGLYCYSLSTIKTEEPCLSHSYIYHIYDCPPQLLEGYSWSLTLLLLLYDIVAVVLHSLLSFSAFKTLKTD